MVSLSKGLFKKSEVATKKQKISTTRAINVPIILVTQSNDYKFVTSEFLKDEWHKNFLTEKSEKGPAKIFDVDENGDLHDKAAEEKFDPKDFPGDPEYKKRLMKFWKEDISKYQTIQKVTIYHLNEKGVYYDYEDLQQFPTRIYLKFDKLETDEEKSRFIREFDFCDFPKKEDQKTINENDPYLDKFVPTEKDKIRAANWLHLYRMHSSFSGIAKSYSEKELTQGDLNYLYRQKKLNVIEIPIDRNSFALQEFENDDVVFENDFLEKAKPTKIKNTDPVIGYRVFGHFALCCLELLLDIEKGENIKLCRNPQCGKQLPDDHGNQKYCRRKDNPECYRQWRNEARKRDRRNAKIRKIKPKRTFPKRNT